LQFESVYTIENKIKDEVLNNPLDLSHPKSLHGNIFRKGKPFFLPRLLDVENAPDEISNKKLLGMKSLFFLPLKIDGEVFAALTMSDTKYQENERIKYLTKEERADLELLSQFVSSALYQALQKEQIQQAQAAVSRAKNEAAVNQLAAHLAHEVNNPLNYIATGKTMQNDSFSKYHEMILGVLSGDDEETKEFKTELDKLQKRFDQGMQQTNEGQDRITKVVAEIRAITGVDGLNFSTFDIVPIINEELVYSLHRNKIKIKEQAIKVRGTDNPIHVLSNSHILARSIRTVISNCVHFARTHKGDDSELYIDCNVRDNHLYMDIGNNSFRIKTTELDDLFDLEKSQAYGTEQIGLAMIKELLLKVNSNLVLADHGRESGKVVFQLQVPTNG
jgi:signal transduction histidine kinase